jgi:hypothetical protein
VKITLPLWVINGHEAMSASCPLSPGQAGKRTFGHFALVPGASITAAGRRRDQPRTVSTSRHLGDVVEHECFAKEATWALSGLFHDAPLLALKLPQPVLRVTVACQTPLLSK